MQPGERTKAAFDFAKDSTTQLIGLATGVMTLTITFSKDLIGDKVQHSPVWMLKISWALYLASIVCGVWTLLALTGTLGRGSDELKCGDIYGQNVRLPSGSQILFFLCATLFALLFAMLRF